MKCLLFRLPELLDPLVSAGLRSIILFGVLSDSSLKDETGSYCINPKAPVPQAIKQIKGQATTSFAN